MGRVCGFLSVLLLAAPLAAQAPAAARTVKLAETSTRSRRSPEIR
jgi:hypothetical protein